MGSALMRATTVAVITGFVAAAAVADTTAPAPSSFTFAVIADPQIGMVRADRDRAMFAKTVRALNALRADSMPRLVLVAGDLVHHGGSADETAAYLAIRKSLAVPVYQVPGNHDMSEDGKRLDAAVLKKYLGRWGEDRFVVEEAHCLFVGLNSQAWLENGARAQEQFAWLEKRLKDRGRYRHVFFVQHHPLYVARPDEKDQYFNTPTVWRAPLLDLLDRSRVSAVLTGHLHKALTLSRGGMMLITTPSTCNNFDKSDYGYSLVTVSDRGISARYVGVTAATSSAN